MSLDTRHTKLIGDGNKLFADRKNLDTLWQEIALNFYVEMADITTTRSRGEDFADHLSTSIPLIARRTLGDSLGALLRPVNLDTASPGIWFSLRASTEQKEDNQGREWLDWATGIQRRAMYDRMANFVRATKEGDHMFATFGNAPLTVEMNHANDGLLFRAWHIRDVVWAEGAEGSINQVHRNWTPQSDQLAETFHKKISPKVKENLKDAPHSRVNCRHIIIERENYELRDAAGKKFNTPYVSIWIDMDNDHLMEEIGSHSKMYVIPRWVTIPGSQYASSPAVIAALPDARLIQSMTVSLLDAGEKAGDPPVVATQEAIRSDVNLRAGGVTWVDAAYDEKLGESLRPLYHPSMGQGIGVGMQMSVDVERRISEAFFLDSLSLPPSDVRDMTAFETGQRISEWIRRANPIFEPMMFEYNGALCDEVFSTMARNGAFGSFDDVPQSIRGDDFRFKFESPLHEGAERRKGQKFLEAKAALMEAAELDPDAQFMLDPIETLRDVLNGIGVPPDWMRDEDEVEKMAEARQEQAAATQTMGELGEMAGAARDLGAASKDFVQSGGAAQGAV